MGHTIPQHEPDRFHPAGPTNPYAASAVVATAPCWIREIFGFNSGPAQFIQLFDAAALPADATACLFGFMVASGQPFSVVLTRRCVNGIVLCNSSTNPAKTIGAADVQFLCNFRLRA